MATVLLLVVTDILYNPTADINDPDAWSSRLQTHQYYQLVFLQRLVGAPSPAVPAAPSAATREDPSPSRRAGPSARSYGPPFVRTVAAYRETGDPTQPLDPRIETIFLNSPALDIPAYSLKDLMSLLQSVVSRLMDV